LAEFTGERVIPGEVDRDLWNEHAARYAFAARVAGGRRVLDAGCGAGYGARLLASGARAVLAIDIAPEAIAYARAHFQAENLRFEQASCLQIPVADAAFDLVVAFEIIEHLSDWRTFLGEVRRVLSPGGQFLVSTPNKVFYAEARAERGPNPFHVHEFAYQEFQQELLGVFPKVELYLENHAGAIVFTTPGAAGAADSTVEEGGANAAEAHFYLAVCSVHGDTTVAPFVYVPRAANMLRERERHIQVLETELGGRIARVVELQKELATEQATARTRIGELEGQLREAVAAATRLAGELEAKVEELTECVAHLHQAEGTVVERTLWAQRNQAEAHGLRGQLQALWSTRWVRLGGKLGLLPKLEPGK
jgi:ubiquinone/menaquinone biosynthesis C-methylase UbiE